MQLFWPVLVILSFVVIIAAVGFWIAWVPVRNAYRMRCVEKEFMKRTRNMAGQLRLPFEPTADLSPEMRRSSALRHLREAEGALLAAQALLRDAASLSWWDIAGLAFDRGRAKQSSWGAAARHMRTAEHLTEDALAVLRMNGAAERITSDEAAVLLEMDTAWLTDGFFADLAVHLRIDDARRQAGRMLSRVEELLQQLKVTL